MKRMNNDLISREALREDLRRFFPTEVLEGIEPKTLFAQIMHDIDNAPTVAVNCKDCDGYEAGYSAGIKDAERPQGEWEDYSVDFYKCPECGYLLNKDCPHCGNKVVLPECDDND